MSTKPIASRRLRIMSTALILLAAGALTGCAAAISPVSFKQDEAQSSRNVVARRAHAAEPGAEGDAVPVASFGDDRAKDMVGQRVVIYSAGYRIVVLDIDAAIDNVEALTDELGGYVRAVHNDRITVRVPADRYPQAIDRVEALGQISERKVETLDVTEDYVDLQARLENARRTRDRLLTLLDKADSVEATIQVEKELNRINEEIERLEGKLHVLQNRIAYSTITVEFQRVAPQIDTVQGMGRVPFPWVRQLHPNRLF